MLKALFNSHQRRFVQLLVLLFLLAGLGTSVYLTQQKTNLVSRAVSAPTSIGCSSTNPNCPAGYKCQFQACTLRYCPENDPNCNTCTGKCIPIPTPKVSPGCEVGLEAGNQSDTSKVNLVVESGAKWVRLNFIGSDWLVNSATVNMYNTIIDSYLARGIKIIGLIGAQSVSGGYDRNHPESFTDPFRDTADDIISRFGDRVKVYELFNEPNDYGGGSSAQITPEYFATYLGRVYRQIKIVRGRSDITLVSGPLLGQDWFGANNTATDYLQDTYNQGKSLSDNQANWTQIKSATGSYPLDAVGYHFYVAQEASQQNQVESQLKVFLSSIKSTIQDLDPGKKLWVSEFGWESGKTGRDGQASALETAFNTLRSDPAVRLAMWFDLQNFTADRLLSFGLTDEQGNKKEAWYTFQRINGITLSPTTPVFPTPTLISTPTSTPTPTLIPTLTPSPTRIPIPPPIPLVTSTACSACKADIDKDGRVSINDMMIAARCLGKRLTDSVGRYSCQLADVDGNGQINLSDLNCVSRQFNQQCLSPGR